MIIRYRLIRLYFIVLSIILVYKLSHYSRPSEHENPDESEKHSVENSMNRSKCGGLNHF